MATGMSIDSVPADNANESDEEEEKKVVVPRADMTPEQDQLLLAEYAELQDVITCNDHSSASNTRRNKAWQKITDSVNAIGTVTKTAQQVKNRWKHLTSTTKKKHTAIAKHRKGTGGGPPMPNLTGTEEKILEMMGNSPNYKGFDNSKESAIGKKRPIDSSLPLNETEPDIAEVEEKKPNVPTIKKAKVPQASDLIQLQLDVLNDQLECQSQQKSLMNLATTVLNKFNSVLSRFDGSPQHQLTTLATALPSALPSYNSNNPGTSGFTFPPYY